MFGSSFRVGRIAGIPIGVSPWWLVIVAFFTWTLGANYFPEAVHGIAPAAAYGLGLASVLLLFAGLLLHELGHAIVARHHGVEVEEIDLWLLGGVSKLHGDAHEPGSELRYALAGPAVSALITAFFGVLMAALPASTPRSVEALVEYQVLINGLILGFNLMPAFPLDGGRVLRALLWRRTGSMQRATVTAARVGRTFGYVLAGLGVLLLFGPASYSGLWLVFIGLFIATAAGQQAMGAELRAAFSGRTAADLMSHPALTIPADTPVDRVADEYFGHYPYTAFPLVDAGNRAVGLITVSGMQSAARLAHGGDPASARQPVARIAESDPALLVPAETDLTDLLERPAFARVGRAIVIDDAGAPVGLLSITDVQRAMRSSRLRAGRDTAGLGAG
ncbi:MAG: site-2 protease family protein [Acidobacteriota bacterium]|nr:site-2 protease family protein [Acidobacteriota bacterium]